MLLTWSPLKIVIVDGYVQLSAHDILYKSYFLTLALALHGACMRAPTRTRARTHARTGGYRACRFPEQAVLLENGIRRVAADSAGQRHSNRPYPASVEFGFIFDGTTRDQPDEQLTATNLAKNAHVCELT